MKKELQSEKIITCLLVAALIFGFVAAGILLGEDFGRFVLWWGTLLILGMICMPFTYTLFHRFVDFGWVFSKSISLALTAWLMWFFASVKILKFSRVSCILVCVLVLVLNLLLYFFMYTKKGKQLVSNSKQKNKAESSEIKDKVITFELKNINAILLGEFLFFLAFMYWSYLRGFNPGLSGTEKYMDFGFMKIMERSDYMPPQDLWQSGVELNYYYVGQFVGTFLSKLSGIGVEYGYNLFLMTIAGLSFALVYSLVRSCFEQLTFEKLKTVRPFAVAAGLISAVAVVFAGNVHYIVYGLLRPWLQKFTGVEVTSYWFPDATRYIGYNPDVKDKTIHEFPCYSFVLGDLHAHVINIIFVVTVLGILFAWLLYRKDLMKSGREYSLVKEIFSPYIILIGFFIGFFHTTNFWDYPIYYVVSGAVILFSNIVLCNFNKYTWIMTAIHGVLVFAIGTIVCLPFTLAFHQISTEIKLCEQHSLWYQLAILWALPMIIVVVYIGNMIYRNAKAGLLKKTGKVNVISGFFASMKAADLFMFVLGLCAIGLTFMPEVIYVKDIYEGEYSRANTMFKLTYQAYIMYGIVIGYALTKLVIQGKGIIKRFSILAFAVWLVTVGYFNQSIDSWFGGHESRDNYQGLDATAFVENDNEADYEGAGWLNENVDDLEIVLEANGDSYTYYNRVSVLTGLPTVMGWHTHEWLWQSWQSDDGMGVPDSVNERINDVSSFYTTTDASLAQSIIDKYDISYIYIGSCEYEKFPTMNTEFLTSLGEVVFEKTTDVTIKINDENQTVTKTTYIVKVAK